MRRPVPIPLLSLLSLCAIFAYGCTGRNDRMFIQESDELFKSGQRTVIAPLGKDWVMYYFPNETANSLRLKIESSAFFKKEGWKSFSPRNPDGFYTGRKFAKEGELGSITLFEGKLNASVTGVDSSSGASVLLFPRGG